MSLIHCIYASTSTCHFGDDELSALLRKARQSNQALGVTGMLLHVDGSFFQVLEGEPEKVDALFGKIASDSRHSRVTIIIREPIARRSLTDWTMGYTPIAKQDVATIVGQNDFFAGASCLADLDDRRAKKLLAAFGKGRWRAALDGAGARSTALA
jgi:Sensors of blue-light using FAD